MADAKRILVTGATGFIGQHVVRELIGNKTHSVISSSRDPSAIAPGAEHQAADLSRRGEATRLIYAVKPDFVIHLAWNAVPGVYWTTPENLTWVSTTLELLEAFRAQNGSRFIFAGTAAEYDWSSGICHEFTTAPAHDSLYGTSKRAVTELLVSFTKTTGFSAAVARLFSLFGPGEPASKLVASVTQKLLKGENVPCPSGNQSRDFLYVKDMASAIVAIALSDVTGPVNVASGKALKLRQLLDAFAIEVGHPELLKFGELADVRADIPSVVASTERLNKEVGWTPKYSLEAGVCETVKFWREQLAKK